MIAIFRLIIFSLICTCLVSPVAYEILLKLEWIFPFSRVFDRVMVFFVVVFIFFERTKIELGQVRLFFRRGNLKSNIKWIGIGALVSIFTSIIAGALLFKFGKVYWGEEYPQITMKMVRVIAPALFISLLEEAFFRVILFMGMVKRLGVLSASLVSAFLYGLAHLVVPQKTYQYPGYSIGVGFDYVGAVLRNLLQWQQSYPFCGLFILGIVLCSVLNRTKSVYLCLGMHAGWIFSVKFSIYTMQFVAPALVHRRYFMVAEPVVWLSFLLALGIVMLTRKKEPS